MLHLAIPPRSESRDLLAVDGVVHRLPDANVGERRMPALLDGDEEPAIARRDDDLHAGVLSRLGFRSAGTPIMRSAEPACSSLMRVATSGTALTMTSSTGGLPEPIFVERLQHQPFAGLVGDELVAACAHRGEDDLLRRVLGIVLRRQDRNLGIDQVGGDDRIRLASSRTARCKSSIFSTLSYFRAPSAKVRSPLPGSEQFLGAIEGEDHRVGVDRLAVVEGQTLA